MVLPGRRTPRRRAERHGHLLCTAAASRTAGTSCCASRATTDVEFLYGKVTDGGVTTGRFLSGVRLGAEGLIASYEVTFDTEHVLVDDA